MTFRTALTSAVDPVARQSAEQARAAAAQAIADAAAAKAETDTGQPAGAGVHVYQQSTATGTRGVVELRDGIAGDSPSTMTSEAFLVPQGDSYTAQGGRYRMQAGSFNGVTGPRLDLAVEAAPAGGYWSVARLVGAEVIDIAGLPVEVPDQTARDALPKRLGLTVLRQDLGGRAERWDGAGWRFRLAGYSSPPGVFPSTDSNAFLSFPHGSGGQPPLTWGMNPTGQATDPIALVFEAITWAADGTNLTLRAKRTDTSQWFPGQPVRVSWWAEF